LQPVPVISIIDDDESVRVATERLIRSLGFSAQAYASAEDFLRSPRSGDTSCIISDVQMPRMNGLELQQALKARGSAPPMIFITAFPNEGMKSRAMAEGAVCFLNKPFDVDALLACLSQALDCPD
jgi:FixJ family two-component response regulator